MVTTLFINFSDAQGQLTPKSVMVSCRNSNSSELLWLDLLSARMKIHPKMKVLEWSQHFSHYKSMGIFPNAQGQLTNKSLVGSWRISNPFEILWLSLLPARIKKNKSKMKELEWSQHFSHYKSMGIFPNAQGQLTNKSLVESWRISNPFEILWLSLLPARIKKNKSKMKELEWSQDFPHYNPNGAICCHGNQSSDPIFSKT